MLLCRNPIDSLSPVFSFFALNQSLVPSLRPEVAVQLRVCVTLCSVLPVTSVVTSGLTGGRVVVGEVVHSCANELELFDEVVFES